MGFLAKSYVENLICPSKLGEEEEGCLQVLEIQKSITWKLLWKIGEKKVKRFDGLRSRKP